MEESIIKTPYRNTNTGLYGLVEYRRRVGFAVLKISARLKIVSVASYRVVKLT